MDLSNFSSKTGQVGGHIGDGTQVNDREKGEEEGIEGGAQVKVDRDGGKEARVCQDFMHALGVFF